MGRGREAATLFGQCGASVSVDDIDRQAAAETVAFVQQSGGQAIATVGDVALEIDVKRMIDERVARFGALHVHHNNADVLWKDRVRSVLETDDGWWERLLAINPEVGLLGDQARHAQAPAGREAIINLGSVSALAGFTRTHDAYTSAECWRDSEQDPAPQVSRAVPGWRCAARHRPWQARPVLEPARASSVGSESFPSRPLSGSRARRTWRGGHARRAVSGPGWCPRAHVAPWSVLVRAATGCLPGSDRAADSMATRAVAALLAGSECALKRTATFAD
jgi:Enoyl-(Acyl carrier protein) reductase